MRAVMKIAHRAVRFGPHILHPGEIIASDGEEGTPVSSEEIVHHLNAGNAEPIHEAAEKAVEPEPEKTVEPEPEKAEAEEQPPEPKTPKPKRRGRPPKRK